MDIDKEAGDVKIDFMHPNGPRKTFNWPQGGDTCYVSTKNIVYTIVSLLQALEGHIKLMMMITTRLLQHFQSYILLRKFDFQV